MQMITNSSELLFSDPAVSVTLFREENYISIHFNGSVTSKAYRGAYEAALKAGITHKIIKWHVNQRNMSVFPDDFKWMMEVMTPKFFSGIGKKHYFAVIQSENFFLEFNTKKFVEKLGEVTTHYFRDPQDAKKWLVKIVS